MDRSSSERLPHLFLTIPLRIDALGRIAWAAAKISSVLIAAKVSLTLFTNGWATTLERWHVELLFFVVVFGLMFLALVLLSRYDIYLSRKRNGSSQRK